MVRYKQEFNPIELELYQQKYKQAKIAYLVSARKGCMLLLESISEENN